MQYRGWTHKIACLGLAALMALTAGAGLASSDATATKNAWTHGEALHAGNLALVPVDIAGVSAPISLSPDGARALVWQDGAPVVVALADGTVSPFWKAADGLPAEIAAIVRTPPKEFDSARISWSCDGKRLAFALIDADTGAAMSEPSGLLWMADLDAGTIAPLKDTRISTPENPAYFSNVDSVAFHPTVPVLYFVASEQTLFSRINPFATLSKHTMMFHYSYESDSVSMMETVTGLLPFFLSPVQCDGGTLTMVTANARDGAELLALVPMHALARTALNKESTFAWLSGQAKLADLRGNTALLTAPSSGSGDNALTAIPLPELLPLEEPEDPELPAVPQKSDFGKPQSIDTKGLAPQAAAFSPAGECVAAMGVRDGKLGLSIVELDSGRVGAVDLSLLNLPVSAEVLDLQWAGNDRLLIQTATETLLCSFSEK